MGPEPAHQDAEGHPLTVVGLAHAAFPKRACCRGHVVITTAKLGAPALAVLTLLGLEPAGGGPGLLWGYPGLRVAPGVSTTGLWNLERRGKQKPCDVPSGSLPHLYPHQTHFSPYPQSPQHPASTSRALGWGLPPSTSPEAGTSRGPKDIQGALRLVCMSCMLGTSAGSQGSRGGVQKHKGEEGA